MIPIHVSEVVRCTTVALRRRTELLGPLCAADPLTADLLEVLSRRPGQPNHWSMAWVDTQLGLAQIAAGKYTEATATLNRSIVAAGQFDHPMTPTVLLELGRLALMRGDYDVALNYFHEASLSAYFYDPGIIEEAFHLATVAHLAANKPGVLSTIPAATIWAKTKRYRQLQASLLLGAAECQLAGGDGQAAGSLLEDAHLVVGRRTMGDGAIGARYHYLLATLLFQQRESVRGYQELELAMAYMRRASRWLFQLARLDHHYVSNNISVSSPLTPRAAMDFYTYLLRDPAAVDWALQPMEALAVLKSPHPHSYEHWFMIAMARKSHERALEIADLGRRHRFHSSLPFGGRLLSLRAILELPQERLPNDIQLLRQNLLAEYEAYGRLSEAAAALRKQLAARPLIASDTEAAVTQRKQFEQWQAICAEQEAILREIAVRREAASLVFPPVRSVKQVREALPEGQALLAFYRAGGEMYGFLLNQENYTFWRMPHAAQVSRAVLATLRAMGQYERNSQFTVAELSSQDWKASATGLLSGLLEGSKADFASDFPELVIVPDGLMWYVPFEALQVEVAGQSRPLIDRFRIRYAPTVSLAAPPDVQRGVSPGTQTAVSIGKLYPREDDELGQIYFERIAKSVPGTVAFPASPLPAPTSLLTPLTSHLIVLDDIQTTEAGPYAWAPVPAERGKPGNHLADWFSLPLGGPEILMLPGFHTAAENSLKSASAADPGSEVFLSVCGLMANGARTILLSRWRSGGQSAVGFVQEFAQELPHTTPADAFQRATLVTAGSRLELEREPRIKDTREGAPTANHPLFWSGFMLIDSGVADPPAVEPGAALLDVDLLR